MSALVESFLANDGKAHFIESLEKNTLKDKNILLLGGFVEEFACVLQQQGVDLKVLESQDDCEDSIQVFLLHPLNFNPYPKLLHFLYEVGCEDRAGDDAARHEHLPSPQDHPRRIKDREGDEHGPDGGAGGCGDDAGGQEGEGHKEAALDLQGIRHPHKAAG